MIYYLVFAICFSWINLRSLSYRFLHYDVFESKSNCFYFQAYFQFSYFFFKHSILNFSFNLWNTSIYELIQFITIPTSLFVHRLYFNSQLIDILLNTPYPLQRFLHSEKKKKYKNVILMEKYCIEISHFYYIFCDPSAIQYLSKDENINQYDIKQEIKSIFELSIRMERSITHCEIIPNRIILKNNNYGHRKTIINKKFEWLNKYLSSASPKMINPSKFSVSSIPSKHTDRKYRNKGLYMENSRLKTQDFEDNTSVLKVRDCNYSELRKTSSSQFPKNKSSKSKQNVTTICKFFKNKKQKYQFSQGKSNYQIPNHLQSPKKSKNIPQDFQIKPWNFMQEDDDDDQQMGYKQRINKKPTLLPYFDS